MIVYFYSHCFLTVDIDIPTVQEEWLTDAAPVQTRILALHAGIFKDLFGPYAYFDALVPMSVQYDYDDQEVSTVFRGNIIKPSEVSDNFIFCLYEMTFYFLIYFICLIIL